MEQALTAIYRNRFSGVERYRAEIWKRLIKYYFGRFLSPEFRVLDLGCGYGEFINNIQVQTRFAMDLNSGACRYLDAAITFFEQDCSEKWPLESGRLDLVFTSNFFEHLPAKDKLRQTLEEAYRCLKHGGRLVALGPNIRFLPGAYWDFWDHHLALSDRSLAEGARLVGFQVEQAISRFLPYSMARGPRYPLWFVGVYVRFPLLWRCFGKQFFVVCRKPV